MIKCYFDNAATTQLCQASKNAMIDAMDCFGNPSSFHRAGQRALDLLEESKRTIADFIKADENEIYFTSGGTEADNLAIIGAATSLKRKGRRIVTTAFEHSAVIGAVDELEKRGFEVIKLSPDDTGSVPLSAFEEVIDENTILVSCMSVNNETGAILPVTELKSIIKQKNSPAYLHIDATQSFGKMPIYPKKCGIDLMTFSSHKIHGPKGVGALFINKGVRILPIIHGGEQQNGLRPGTEPTILIAGFAAAVRDIGNINQNEQIVSEIYDYIKTQLSAIDGVKFNIPKNSSKYVLNISIIGFKSETMLHFLDGKGISVSSGSACSKGKKSHVLSAMGFDKFRIDSAIRISFSKYNTLDEAKDLILAIDEATKTLIRTKSH